MVRSGIEYKIAQIDLRHPGSHQFFMDLKSRYRSLRGNLRMYFSVWTYSHCDFYMCEKFEQGMFVPKKEHDFPSGFNADYDFIPKPVDREQIPPVTPHEFYKRFYACYDPTPMLHFYHRCTRLAGHSGDVLDRFPKKKTELEEGGDGRETFWGIYARENVALARVLVYNFICITPTLVFFFAWLIPHGSDEMQNAAVPVSVMVAMLSLFWGVFVSCKTSFGESSSHS
ncbi:hypothetical protein LX36DRAFT_589782 [Colletotrichum falcatum]|nr:hypothetical protein LX36DRAFT_589782 [Colletotrichum falcatum]